MIPIVEDYLSDLITGKFANLKSNPSMIDKILSTSQIRLDRLKSLIQTRPINVIMGYPITPAVMPCVCILLSGEEETQMGVGDYGEETDITTADYTEQLQVIDARGSEYPFPYVQVTNPPLSAVSQIVNNDLSQQLTTDEFWIEDADKGIVGMTGGSVEDGDMVTLSYTYEQTVVEQMEVLYESNYRIEIWATNGDLTVELYHLVKWALLSGRGDLIKNYDIFRQKLSGADFEPVTAMFPDYVYRRALSFWCQFSVSTPDEQSGFITGVQVNETDYTDEFGSGL